MCVCVRVSSCLSSADCPITFHRGETANQTHKHGRTATQWKELMIEFGISWSPAVSLEIKLWLLNHRESDSTMTLTELVFSFLIFGHAGKR